MRFSAVVGAQVFRKIRPVGISPRNSTCFRGEIPTGRILPSTLGRQGSATRRNRSALAMTDTDDRLIAALAIIGESTHPKNG